MWEQTFKAYDEKWKNVAKFENTSIKQTTKSRFLDKENKSCVLSNMSFLTATKLNYISYLHNINYQVWFSLYIHS